MIEIIKELNIEVSKPNVFQAVVAKQYDMNTRFIKATFVDNGEKITIDPDATVKVTINALRPDGESRGFDGEVNQDGTVTVPLHSWMLELVGTVTCDISVIDTKTDDNKRLTTTSFALLVEKAAWGGAGSTDDPQSDVLVELRIACETAVQASEEAVEKCNEAVNSVPVVDVSSISGGHRVAITDKNGTETFDVMDGAAGPAGPAGATTLDGTGLTIAEDGAHTKLQKITVAEDTTEKMPEFRIEAPFTTNVSPYNNDLGKDTSLIKLVAYSAPSIMGAGQVGGISRTLVWGRDVNGTMASALFASKADSANSYLGTSSNPWGTICATNGTIQTSAREAKENIKSVISAATPTTFGLRGGEPTTEDISDITTETIVDFVRNLQPVTFNYKTDDEEIKQESVQLGLIADDIAEHDVYKYIGVTGEEGQQTYGLQALPLVTAALTVCKHLLEQVDILTARIEELEAKE